MMKTVSTSIVLVLSMLLSGYLYAEIYQVTDSKGNKTYTNIAPKADGQNQRVEKITIREVNTTPSDGVDNDEYFKRQIDTRDEYDKNTVEFESELEVASKALKDAEKELEQAKEIKSGDYFNIPGKGMRYKDGYTERVQQAEEKVERAKEQLQAIQKNKPSKPNLKVEPAAAK